MSNNIESVYIDTRNRLTDSISTSDFKFRLNNDRRLKYVNKISLVNHNINFNDQYLINNNNNIMEIYSSELDNNAIPQKILINSTNGVKNVTLKKQIISIEPGNYNLDLLGQKLHISLRNYTDNFEVIKYNKDNNSFELYNLDYYYINNENILYTIDNNQIFIKERFINAFKKYITISSDTIINNKIELSINDSFSDSYNTHLTYFSTIINVFSLFFNESTKMIETPITTSFNHHLNNAIKYIIENNSTYNIITNSILTTPTIQVSKLSDILNSLDSNILSSSSLSTLLTIISNSNLTLIDLNNLGNNLTSLSLLIDEVNNPINKIIYNSIYSLDSSNTLEPYNSITNTISTELLNALNNYQLNINSTDITVITDKNFSYLNFDINLTNIYKFLLNNFSLLTNSIHNDFNPNATDINGKYYFFKFGLTNSDGTVNNINFEYNQNDIPSLGRILGFHHDRIYSSTNKHTLSSIKSPSIIKNPYIYLSINNYHNFDIFDNNINKEVTFIIDNLNNNKEQEIVFANGIHINLFNIKLYDFYGDIIDLGNKDYYIELKIESNILNY